MALTSRPRWSSRCTCSNPGHARCPDVPTVPIRWPRSLGEVAIHGPVAVGIVIDDDDQSAQIAVVPRHRDAAAGRRQHVRAHSASDVEAPMGIQPRVALRAQPVAKARKNPRSPVRRGRHRPHEVSEGQQNEEHRHDGVDEHGNAAPAPVQAAAPNESDERAREQKHGERGSGRRHRGKEKSGRPLSCPG